MKRAIAVLTVATLLLAVTCCGTVAAEEATYTPGNELLINGDFENGTTAWAGDAAEPGHKWIKNGVGRDGSAGMQLTDAEKNAD